jgi:hypothetical protein
MVVNFVMLRYVYLHLHLYFETDFCYIFELVQTSNMILHAFFMSQL